MKVLHITPLFPTESNPGKGTFIKSQIDSLRELVDIDLLVLPGNRGMLPYLLETPKIKQKIKGDYDIIHIHFGHVSTLIKMMYKGDAAIVTSYLGSDLLGKKSNSLLTTLKGDLFKNLNKSYGKRDAHSIVKTQEMAEILSPYSESISVIPNGVDTKIFNRTDQIKAREKLNLPADKKIILFPSDTNLKVKNFDLLADALKGVDTKDYHLVTFEGGNIPYTMVPTYLSASDLVVCASHHEGSPNILKEAMACNCTIFSTEVGDVKWLLEGVLDAKILPYSATDWTEAINQHINGSKNEASNARDILISKNLMVEKIAERIVDIYTRVTKDRR